MDDIGIEPIDGAVKVTVPWQRIRIESDMIRLHKNVNFTLDEDEANVIGEAILSAALEPERIEFAVSIRMDVSIEDADFSGISNMQDVMNTYFDVAGLPYWVVVDGVEIEQVERIN